MTRDRLKTIVAATKSLWHRGFTRGQVKEQVSGAYDCPKELVEMILRSTTGVEAALLF